MNDKPVWFDFETAAHPHAQADVLTIATKQGDGPVQVLDFKTSPVAKAEQDIYAYMAHAMKASADISTAMRQTAKARTLGMRYGTGPLTQNIIQSMGMQPQNLPRTPTRWQHGVVEGHVGVVLRLQLLDMGFSVADIEKIDKLLPAMQKRDRAYRLYATRGISEPITGTRKFVFMRADNVAPHRMRWLYDSAKDRWNMKFRHRKT